MSKAKSLRWVANALPSYAQKSVHKEDARIDWFYEDPDNLLQGVQSEMFFS